MAETGDHQSTQTEIMIWLLSRSVLAWQQVVVFTQRIMRELHIYEFMDMAAVYLVHHPVMALFVFVMALCCGIPILMFVVFAVLTVILTFTGFIVIEGTILTVGSVLLCGFLLGMLVVMLALAATIGIAYFGFLEIYGLLQKNPENSPVSRFLSNHLRKQEVQIFPQKTQTNTSQQQLDNHHED